LLFLNDTLLYIQLRTIYIIKITIKSKTNKSPKMVFNVSQTSFYDFFLLFFKLIFGTKINQKKFNMLKYYKLRFAFWALEKEKLRRRNSCSSQTRCSCSSSSSSSKSPFGGLLRVHETIESIKVEIEMWFGKDFELREWLWKAISSSSIQVIS